MTDATPAAKPKGSLAARLWTYQAERFPVFQHGALIAAFGASAVCLSALLRGGAPDLVAILVARPLGTDMSPVFARYALPLAPVILFAAALGLDHGLERIAGRSWARPELRD